MSRQKKVSGISPHLTGLKIDGDGRDWGKRGFCVDLLTTPDWNTLPADDYDVTFRLAWDDDGLYILVKVKDDIGREQESLSRLWRGDCIELIAADGRGHKNRFMLAIATGADPRFTQARSRMYDFRHEDYRKNQLLHRFAVSTSDKTATVEVFFPGRTFICIQKKEKV